MEVELLEECRAVNHLSFIYFSDCMRVVYVPQYNYHGYKAEGKSVNYYLL
jgi:hypothetical protein